MKEFLIKTLVIALVFCYCTSNFPLRIQINHVAGWHDFQIQFEDQTGIYHSKHDF